MTGSDNIRRQHHEGETLRLIDLADERGLVEHHDFLRCTIHGPALVVFAGGMMHFNRFEGAPDKCFYDVGEDRERYIGAIVVHQCQFESCTFWNVGFTGPPESLGAMKDSFKPLEDS